MQGVGHRFQKGVSGNPGGRPKAVRHLLEQARKSVPKALRFAKNLLGDEDADPRIRLEAAKFLCSYGLGAPPKVIDLDAPVHPEDALDGLTAEELRNIARGALRDRQPAEKDDDGDPEAPH